MQENSEKWTFTNMMFKPSSMKITQLVQKLLGVTVHRHMDITIPKYFSKMHFYRKSLQN